MSDAPVNCTEAELAEYLKNLRMGFTCEPCTYSPEQAGESSPTNSLATPRSVPWRSMSIASKCLRQGKRTAVFHGFQSLRMSSTLMVGLGAGWLMLSPVDSPVRTFQRRARASESLEPGQGYGRTWPELSVRFDPDTLSLRTLPCSPGADSTASSLILPRWGLMRAGVLSAPPKSARHTSATGSGLWPTPTVCGNYNRKGASPNSGDGLATAVKRSLWPTPTATLGTHGGRVTKEKARLGGTLIEAVSVFNDVGVWGQLNPAWVERMMGWPDGWTDLTLREPVPVPTGWGEDWEGDVPRTVTGVPHRTSRLKALGNGQVPQAAAAAWLMLTKKNRLTSGRQW